MRLSNNKCMVELEDSVLIRVSWNNDVNSDSQNYKYEHNYESKKLYFKIKSARNSTDLITLVINFGSTIRR